jgi:hypothetical protein
MSFGAEPTSTYGTATINGTMDPGEWDNAAKIDFQANVPPSDGGGTTPATLYVMNDGLNLYLAVKITRPSFGYYTYVIVYFDNKNVGFPQDGDDVVQLYVGQTRPLTFLDMYRFTSTGAPAGSAGSTTEDTDYSTSGCILPAGQKDGAWAANNDGSVTFIEFSRLLNSKDVLHDFSLKPGDTLGYNFNLRLYSIASPRTIADTIIPASGTGAYYGQITLAQDMVTRVIDIKPGGSVNSINRKSEGKIPVAILSTADFSAPVSVDRTLLTFGRTGVEASPVFCNSGSEDVNNDGLPDLICHFATQLTGFQLEDSFGILKGQTTDGTPFSAKDSVRIVK